MATVRHLGLFPRPNSIDPPCLDVIPTGEEDPERDKTWHQVTLQQAIKAYWRVKRWQATINAEYSVPRFVFVPDPEAEGAEGVGDFVFDGFDVIPITEIEQLDPTFAPLLEVETELVCRPNVTPNWFALVSTEIELNVIFKGFLDLGQNGPLNIRKDPDPDSKDLYVAFTATLFGAGFGNPFVFDDIQLSEDLVFTISWDRTRNDEYSSPYSGTVEVKPQEYWPYDPKDGLGPIYDSETGEQLRGFPA
jgi:hypothetical protein